MKKIFVILEAGDAIPSGVVRGLIYKEQFIKNGYEVRYINRFPAGIMKIVLSPRGVMKILVNAFLSGAFSSQKNWAVKNDKPSIFKRTMKKMVEYIMHLRNVQIAQIAKGYDAVYMSKVRSYGLVQELKKHKGLRIVQDFGDAIWLPNRHSNNYFDITNFNTLLGAVDAVTCDNEYTAEYARKFNTNVTAISDYPQTHLFDKERSRFSKGKGDALVIGWIGSPNTVYNLYVIWEALEEVFKKHKNLRLRLVGTGTAPNMLPEFENVNYSVVTSYTQDQMVEEILQMDIGLFPLQNTEASKVRGVLKACIFMSGGVAVVASPVGQSVDFIKDGVNGMLATTKEEWIEKLEKLITDAELRSKIANAGLESVRKKFSLEENFKKLITIIEGK